MKKNILVTGGTGFLGYNLIKELINKGYKVTSLSSKKKNNKNYFRKVKYIFCDITNFHKLKKKIENDYDYIINFCGNINHKNKSETFHAHFHGLKNLIGSVNKDNLKLFIQIGSSLEYGRSKSPQKENTKCKPISHYGKAKYLASKYIIQNNIKNFLILRLYQVYGPYQKTDRLIPYTITSCLGNKKFDCSEGLQIRDFIYVSDFVDLVLKILNKKKIHSGIYNVGSGKPISVKKVINLIVKKIKKGHANFAKIKMRNDEIMDLYPNLEKIKKIFNWKPRVNIQRGLIKTINHYAKK